ncbi:MAG: hypothetical protein K6F11_04405 [Lachnospiraceae bacterium]|nr:hypothetical protein [Lachnospiraceae bacterium]
MEKKTGKKLNLTKKQFIIAIAAVCGIALIIEAALLIHTFSKGKGDKKKGNAGKAGTEKRAENAAEALSYTVTTYRYEDGKQILEKVETLETDCDGRILHEHTSLASPLKGENSDEDVVYTYDEEGRLIKEVHTTNQNRPDKTTFRYEYDYETYGGEPITVKRKINEEEIQVEVEQSWYNDAGKMTYYSWSSGDGIIKEEHRAYNAMGNLIAAQTTDQDGFHAEYDETARVSDRFLQGRLALRNYFDEEDRLIRSEEIGTDGDPQYYTVYEYASGPICTKSTTRNATDGSPLYEKVFDEQGRISRIYWYGGFCTEFFDWDYEDPMLPGKKVLRCSTYNGRLDAAIEGKDELARDSRYVITPMSEVALEAERRKEDKDPSLQRYAFLKTDAYVLPYVTTDGKGHEYGWELNGYNYVDYTMGFEDGFWYARAEFEDGRIKSIFFDNFTSDSIDSNQLWEYDEQERLVCVKELLPDDTVRRESIYEYQTED